MLIKLGKIKRNLQKHKDSENLEVKGRKQSMTGKYSQMKDSVAILIPDKIDFEVLNIKENCYIIIKDATQQKDIIPSMYNYK